MGGVDAGLLQGGVNGLADELFAGLLGGDGKFLVLYLLGHRQVAILIPLQRHILVFGGTGDGIVVEEVNDVLVDSCLGL